MKKGAEAPWFCETAAVLLFQITVGFLTFGQQPTTAVVDLEMGNGIDAILLRHRRTPFRDIDVEQCVFRVFLSEGIQTGRQLTASRSPTRAELHDVDSARD